MSLLERLRVRVREWEVVNDDDRSVRVARDGDRIEVRWLCGDTFSFTGEDLRAAIDHVDRAASYPDVWLSHRDSDDDGFVVRVVDGDFYADQRPNDQAGCIAWDDLRATLQEALAR